MSLDDCFMGCILEFIGGETVYWTWEEHGIVELPITNLKIVALDEEIPLGPPSITSSITASGMGEFTITELEALEIDPPTPGEIDGPTSGKAGTEYTYTFTNPGTQSVYFLVDWGDGGQLQGTKSEAPPGGGYFMPHIWEDQGDYTIRARAMNEYGMLSGWTELSVSMPRNRATHTPLLKFLEDHPYMFPLLRQLFGL